jgi:hypothetical protein
MTHRRLLSELARLGARLIIQRAVEEEFDTDDATSVRDGRHRIENALRAAGRFDFAQ